MTKRTSFEETFDFPPSVCLLRFKINSGHTQTDVTLSFLSFLHMSPPPPPPPAGRSQVRSCSFDFVGPIRISKPKRQRPKVFHFSFSFFLPVPNRRLLCFFAFFIFFFFSSGSIGSPKSTIDNIPTHTLWRLSSSVVGFGLGFSSSRCRCCGGSYKIK